MHLKRTVLFAFVVIALVLGGCTQQNSQTKPTATPQQTQMPTATPSPTPEITPFLTPTPLSTPSPTPTKTPSPTPVPETIVVDGNKQNWNDISPGKRMAMSIALEEKSFKLFCSLPEIYHKYIIDSLSWQEKYRNCSPKKKEALEKFVNGIRVTIIKTDKNVYRIKATHPILYKGERFNWQSTGKTIIVDIGSKKIVNSTFYQPYNGLLLSSVFTAEGNLLLGFSEYHFGTQDYKVMADRFAETFCQISDEDFR